MRLGWSRQWVTSALIQAPWLAVAPLLLSSRRAGWPSLEKDGFESSLFLSLGVATTTAVFCIGMGLAIAWFCRDSVVRGVQLALPLLLLPLLMGQVAAGFLCKIAILRLPLVGELIGSRGAVQTFVFLVLMYAYQYGPMCAYMLWLRIRELPVGQCDYASVARLSPAETFSDVIWPHLRSLCQVLGVLVLLLTTTEYAVSELSIGPSSGTGSSLLTHWLAETYRVWLPAGPALARAELAFYGVTSAIIVLAAAGFITAICSALGDLLARLLPILSVLDSAMRSVDRLRHRLGSVVAAFGLSLCLAPIVLSFAVFPPRPFAQATELIPAVFYAALAGLASVTVSLGLALLARESARRGMFLRLRSAGAALFMLNPLAMPSFVVSIAAFGLVAASWNTSFFSVLALWSLGHVLMAMPLIVAFGYWLHSRVTDAELEYQQVARLSWLERARVTFFDRLRAEYVLVLVFAWSLAWNDGVVNRVTSGQLPSLYAVLSPRISVRPDYEAAQFALLLSVTAAVGMALSWSWLQVRSEARKRG